MDTLIVMTDSAKSLEKPEFEQLLAPISGQIRGYIYRMIGNRADSEDLLQETLRKAYERREKLLERSAFKAWIYRIATSTCLDFLRKKKRWSDLVQKEVERECHEDQEQQQGVIDATRDSEFTFDAHAHLSFCFTCVGRSLPPDQQAAIVLKEVLGLTNQEAADTLELGEGKFRHALSDGRRAMEASFDGLCSLVNKKGICHQCEGLRGATAAERRGPSLPVLTENPWRARISAVKKGPVEDGVSQPLHELLFSRMERVNRERCSGHLRESE